MSTRTPEDINSKCLGAFAESRKMLTLASSCRPVDLHACLIQQGSQRTEFCEVFYREILLQFCRENWNSVISDKNIRQFTAMLYCYLEEHR